MTTISKAIFPVAGLGTRFLPATKASPKEMLPIVDKPLIQYAVEEAIAAGIRDLIFITSSSKQAIENHFDSNYELETKLALANKQDLLNIVKKILPKGINCIYLRQSELLGLGHAVLCAQPLVGQEAFAVLLADDLISASIPCLKQMLAIHAERNTSVIAVQRIEKQNSDQYGIIGHAASDNKLRQLTSIIEKPTPAEAPSNLAVVGRYLLTPSIFKHLAKTPRGKSDEIQLTDAIAGLLTEETIYSWEFSGVRYDCGSKLGYLQATVAYALEHPETKLAFSNYLQSFRT